MRYYLTCEQPQQVLWYWEWISDYLWRYGRYVEYVECDHYALAAANQLALIDPPEGQCKMAMISAELAFAYMELGEPARAEQYVQQAEQLFRQLGDLVGVARVLRYRAALQCRFGDCDTAEKLCQEAFRVIDEIERQGQDTQSSRQQPADTRARDATMQQLTRGRIHSLLGGIYLDQGKYAAARKELLTALKAARTHEAGSDKVYWSLAPRLNLGRLHGRCSKIDMAKRYYRQCIALTEDGTSPNIRAAALLRMAMLVAREGDRERASHLAQEAVNLYEAMGTYGEKTKAVRFLETLERKP
jgi:tetratricopeptide (TPR) repeat protein